MARKPKHEEHENHERWLISYADFITLLFAFFVVMYSVSSVNEGKFRVLSDALVAAFRSSNKSMEPIQVGQISKSKQEAGVLSAIVDQQKTGFGDQKSNEPEHPLGVDQAAEQKAANERVAIIMHMADQIEKDMAGLIQQDLITVRRGALWIEIEIKTSILFSSGSALLQPDSVPVLQQLAKILQGFPNPIRVEGFTDSIPISTAAFPSNWELSAGRAASVVHLFSTAGIAPQRLAAIGFGEFRPIADNSSAEGRGKNRRVVIVVLESAQAERIFSTQSQAGGDASPPAAVPASPVAAPRGHSAAIACYWSTSIRTARSPPISDSIRTVLTAPLISSSWKRSRTSQVTSRRRVTQVYRCCRRRRRLPHSIGNWAPRPARAWCCARRWRRCGASMIMCWSIARRRSAS